MKIKTNIIVFSDLKLLLKYCFQYLVLKIIIKVSKIKKNMNYLKMVNEYRFRLSKLVKPVLLFQVLILPNTVSSFYS